MQNRCQIRLGDASGRHTHEIPGDRDARIHQTFSVLYSKQESITPQPSLFYRFYGLMPPASFSARPPRGHIKTMLFFNLFMFWKFSFARIGIQLMVSMRCMCIEPRILYTLFFYYSLFALVWCNMLRFNKTSMRSLTLILTSYLVLSLVLYQNLYFLVHVLFCWTAFCMS